MASPAAAAKVPKTKVRAHAIAKCSERLELPTALVCQDNLTHNYKLLVVPLQSSLLICHQLLLIPPTATPQLLLNCQLPPPHLASYEYRLPFAIYNYYQERLNAAFGHVDKVRRQLGLEISVLVHYYTNF